MKKFIALLAILAASSLAQGQNTGALADHPEARNDRMSSDYSVHEKRHEVGKKVHHYGKTVHYHGKKNHHHRKHQKAM